MSYDHNLKCFFLLTVSLTILLFSCGKEEILECPELGETLGVAEINSKERSLLRSHVWKGDALDLDIHEIAISAIGNDCNQILKLRFYASVPDGEKLEGEFKVLESEWYTAYRLTSLSFTIETIEPQDFNIVYAAEGSGTIISNENDEYVILGDILLQDGREVSFKYHFQL